MSRDCISKLFSLQEIAAADVLVNGETGTGLADLNWSWSGNTLASTVGAWIETLEEGGKRDENLLQRIIEGVRKHWTLLHEKYYSDGKLHASYLYFVLKRLPRQGTKEEDNGSTDLV